jgi:hypothetical protein
VVFDLTPHHRRFTHHRFGQVILLRLRRIEQHRQRRLERMGQIARMGPRFFSLPLIMRASH